MPYVYVLYSKKDGKRYTGCTMDLNKRLQEHREGNVKSTKSRRPLKLVYYEWCEDIRDAMAREKYLKTYYGKSFIKKRIQHGIAKERGT